MTEAAIEKRLWFSLSCSDIRWRKARKHTYAMVVAEVGKRYQITLPPDADDDYTLRTLIHELLHVTVAGELGAFGVFEEDILERVLEPRMLDYLLRNPKKHERWLRALRVAKEAKRGTSTYTRSLSYL